jgi:hypothetical protein
VKGLLGAVLGGLAGACAGCGGADPGPDCDSEAEPVVGVFTRVGFERPRDGTSDGFDLDGQVSEAGGGTGCGLADYRSPDGRAGIDNGFARMLPALELTEAAAVEDLFQEAINNGDFLLLYELLGADDLREDDCVQLNAVRGTGTVLLGTDGYLESEQTIDRDEDRPTASAHGLEIREGVLVAEGLELELPLNILNASLTFHLYDASLRIEFSPDGEGGGRGMFAGSMDSAALVEVAHTQNVDPALADTLQALLDLNSDIDADGDGACERISVTFAYESRPAFLLD